MSTPNFSLNNAKHYYILNDTYQDGDGIEVQRDWIDWQVLCEDIQYMGKELGFTPIPSDNREWREQYDIEIPLLDKSFLNKYYTFEAGIGLNSGYYSGACFDFDIFVSVSYGRCNLSEYQDLQEFAETLANDLFEWGELSDWNEGLKVMNRSKVGKYLLKELQKVADECDQFMASNSEETYNCVGIFSNGEAVYTKSA